MIQAKRAYDPPAKGDGARFLVDRLWPRGIKKEELKIDGWLKEVAPSDDLRKWFDHDPDRWEEFRARYAKELDEKPEALDPIREAARQGDITLIFAAKDTEHNNAVALKVYLKEQR
ncbi:MAG: DUF488 domain-containing protein [Anaerolineae bacterium]|jgi:uncharacterized protein YeaO (DUF488 family)